MLHLGSIYLVVKDFEASIRFYEALLEMPVTGRNGDKFAQFMFEGHNISLMNEARIPEGHDYTGSGDYKFVLNFWIEDLAAERRRVTALNIGPVTEVRWANPGYAYFHLRDPDNNVIEVTGEYTKYTEG